MAFKMAGLMDRLPYNIEQSDGPKRGGSGHFLVGTFLAPPAHASGRYLYCNHK